MPPAFDVKQCPHQNDRSILSQWLDLEASFPNSPIDFFVPDNTDISDNSLEGQLKTALHNYITASIQVRQARFAYGHCLAKLARRKAAKKRRTNSLSPVFRLPNELISYIFQIIHQPILLSYICHHWRAIAINTPSLWCYLDHTLGHNETKLFLKRARNHPLMVYLPDFYHDIPLRLVKELSVIIAEPASLQHFCNEPAPLLEYIHIDSGSEEPRLGGLEYLFNVSLFANHAPKLRAVKLDTLVLPNFPTQSLTELILTFCFFPETATTIRLLETIPTLQSLTLSKNKFKDRPSEPLDCQLPSVKRLSVCYTRHTNINMITPNLADLYLSAEIADYPVVHPGSSLRLLWLMAEHFERRRSQLIHRLQLIRTQLEGVQTLQITAESWAALEPILTVLFRGLKANFLFPSLCQLIIDCHCDPHELADILQIVREPNVNIFYAQSRLAHEDVVVFMYGFDELRCIPLSDAFIQVLS